MKISKEDIGEICGIFAGDGNLDRTKPFIRIYISIDEKEYAKYVAFLLEKYVGRKIKINRDKRNVYIVYVYSQDLENLLKSYLVWNKNKSKTIRLETEKHSIDFVKGFLRGLLDTDGSVRRGTATFNTVSSYLRNQIIFLIKKLGFKYSTFSWNYKNGTAFKIFLNTLETKKLVEFLDPNNKKRINLGTKLIDHHEEAQIIKLRQQGINVYSIAEKLKRSHASISNVLLKHGLSERRITMQEARKILNFYKKCYNLKEVSKITNKPYYIVWWTVKKRLIS